MTEQRVIYQVSQLTTAVKRKLEQSFPSIWIEGEISNFSCPASGHWYFSLKDDKAQIKAACFRFANQRLKIQPCHGDKVLIQGRLSLYEPRGDFQLIVDYLESAGEGVLRRAFEKLKEKLLQEGLFEQDRKQPLPIMPQHIAVVTSPTGAVIRDILTVLKRRFPAIAVTVFPASVQGDSAVQSIVQALQVADQVSGIALIIVARGGGSLEDLQPFNEEAVARAISACSKPVVSAVGHETDVTIADFVADCRAPTPSVAAELVSPDQQEWLANFQSLSDRLARLIFDQLQVAAQKLDFLKQRLRHPREQLRHYRQQYVHYHQRLQALLLSQMERKQSALSNMRERLKANDPGRQLLLLEKKLQYLQFRLEQAAENSLIVQRQRFENYIVALNGLNPLKILERGYCVASCEDKRVVRRKNELKKGDKVHLKLMEGEVDCEVL